VNTIEHSTKLDQRVRLKSNGEDALYRAAHAGSEGWVRKHTKDEYGYPMIWIEWDTLHWAFNGETDMWTYESHFEIVNERLESMHEEEPSLEEYKQFKQWLNSQKNSGKSFDVKIKEEYDLTLKEAVKLAKNSDSFLLITVDREDDPTGEESPTLVPRMSYYYQTDICGHTLELQLAKIATSAHEGLVYQTLNDILDDEEDHESGR
jgi:uncharacterized protein YktA (UPF0223 family)